MTNNYVAIMRWQCLYCGSVLGMGDVCFCRTQFSKTDYDPTEIYFVSDNTTRHYVVFEEDGSYGVVSEEQLRNIPIP